MCLLSTLSSPPSVNISKLCSAEVQLGTATVCKCSGNGSTFTCEGLKTLPTDCEIRTWHGPGWQCCPFQLTVVSLFDSCNDKKERNPWPVIIARSRMSWAWGPPLRERHGQTHRAFQCSRYVRESVNIHNHSYVSLKEGICPVAFLA